MATDADIGSGIILKKGNADGPPETYTDFGLEITSIDAPGMTRDVIDATHMQSPNNHREKILGLMDTPAINFAFNWDPSATDDLVTAIGAGIANWQILFPDASTVTVPGGITAFSMSGLTPEGKMSGSGTFTPTGIATWA